MIIKGRELISALSINSLFNNSFVQREPAINQYMSTVCVCMCVFVRPCLLFLFVRCVIEIKTLLFNTIQRYIQGYQTNCCWTLLSDTDTACHLLNVSHQLPACTHGSAHYTLHSNSYIATAADCLATAAKTSRGVHGVFQMTPFLFTNAFYDFFFSMLFRSISTSPVGIFSLSCPQISAPSLMWRWPETAQMSAVNWATQTPAGCPGIPPPFARPGTSRNCPPSCLTRKEGAWDAWQTGAPGWAARSTGHASHPRAVPIPTVVTTPVRTAPWRRCPSA